MILCKITRLEGRREGNSLHQGGGGDGGEGAKRGEEKGEFDLVYVPPSSSFPHSLLSLFFRCLLLCHSLVPPPHPLPDSAFFSLLYPLFSFPSSSFPSYVSRRRAKHCRAESPLFHVSLGCGWALEGEEARQYREGGYKRH